MRTRESHQQPMAAVVIGGFGCRYTASDKFVLLRTQRAARGDWVFATVLEEEASQKPPRAVVPLGVVAVLCGMRVAASVFTSRFKMARR